MTQISSIISNIRYWIVHIPLKDDISWASGKRTGSTRLICEITTDEGVKGYGETICLLDFVPTVFEKVIIPLGLGLKLSDVERLTRAAEGAGYYHHKRALVFALSALEMAMWDAKGKVAGLSLHELWGGAYREKIEMCAYIYISDHDQLEKELIEYGQEILQKNNSVKLIGNPKERGGVLSFTIEGVHPHDIATILDETGVAIRAGHHCCQILHDKLNIPASARASLGVYNTKDDLDKLNEGINNCKKIFDLK